MGTRRGTIGGGEGHERGGKRAGGTRPDRPTDGRGTGWKGRGGSACIPERRRPVCGTPARSVESRRLRHNPISSSFSDSLRPKPLARRRRRPSSSRSRPLARPSLSPSRSFFPFSLHPALALFLSLAPARSLDLVSLSLSLSLRISSFLSSSPSSHLVESRLFPTLVLFFFSRQCGVTACFAARNACVATCVPLSFLLSLSFPPSSSAPNARHYCPFHFKQRFLSLPLSFDSFLWFLIPSLSRT